MAMVIFASAIMHKSRKDPLGRSIYKLFATIVVAIAFNTVFVMSAFKYVAYVSHSIYLAIIGWILLFMMEFVLESCDMRRFHTKKLFALQVLVSVDSVILIVNPIFHHIFTIEQATSTYFGTHYAIASYGPYFYVHFFISFVLVQVTNIILLIKALRTPKGYRMRYWAILMALTAIFLVDIIGIILDLPIDIFLICYCAASLLLFFFAIIYVPKTMTDNMFTAMMESSDMGVAFFEIDGKCVHINERVKEMAVMAHQKDPEDVNYKDEIGQSFQAWLKKKAIPEGDDEVTFPYTVEDEIGHRTYHFEFTIQRLKDAQDATVGYFARVFDRTQEYEDIEEQEYRANHDPLTGIYNESYFTEKVQETLLNNRDTQYIMICSDIKDFKMVNDIFGAEFGDEILKAHARALKAYTPKGSVYGRLVKDRFAMCIPLDRFKEERLLEIVKQIEENFTNDYFKLQVKLGALKIENVAEPIYVMVDRCNMVIDTIQSNYSQTIGYFDESLLLKEMQYNKIVNDFDRALYNNEFHMYLQSHVDNDGKLLGAEALARWIHPIEGMISPGVFIPVLEDASLIYKLDLRIWEMAARQLAKWKAHGLGHLHISVNMSAQDQYFLDIYKVFTGLVEKYEIDPSKLHIEITETTLINDVNAHLDLMGRLQDYGFEISIDDFGSGYSSLNVLKDITADELKLDMVFLRKTTNVSRSLDIISSVITLAKRLDMHVVAEGVETEEQLNALREMGCDIYQGYYFSRPVPVEEFESKFLTEG